MAGGPGAWVGPAPPPVFIAEEADPFPAPFFAVFASFAVAFFAVADFFAVIFAAMLVESLSRGGIERAASLTNAP